MDEGGKVLDSKVLGQSNKPKFQDKCRTSFKIEEPCQAQKRIPQKQCDLDSKVNQGKNQTQKPQEGGPSQLKPLE